MCIGCDEHLTIEHVLLTCSDLTEIRESHFTAQSLRVSFQEISAEKIFNFLRKINLFLIFKLQIILLMFVPCSPFKHGFKIVHIPVLTHIHFKKIIYDEKMCIALM